MVLKTVVDWVIRVVVVVGLVVGGWLYSGYQDFVECQARYNDRMNARTVAISEAQKQERESEAAHDKAQNALLTDPAALKPREERTPEEQQRITAKTLAWVEASRVQDKERAEADAARAANPIPPPPSEVCG